MSRCGLVRKEVEVPHDTRNSSYVYMKKKIMSAVEATHNHNMKYIVSIEITITVNVAQLFHKL